MREIKFNFIYGVDGETETYFNKTFTFGEIEGGCHFDEISDSPLLRNYTILGKRQYTGLKDVNGKDIYEGDILQSYGKKYNVIFENGCFCHSREEIGANNNKPYLDTVAFKKYVGPWEVIGNIYENGDLLANDH